MLRKLFKLEFASSYRKICLMYMVLVVITALTYIESYIGVKFVGLSASFVFEIFSAVLSFGFTVTVVVVAVMGFFLAYVSFYRSMYSPQGYLTHTLPVDPVMNFAVKTVVSFVWVIASFLLIGVCYTVKLAGTGGKAPFYPIAKMFKHGGELWDTLAVGFESFTTFKAGGTVTAIIIILLLAILHYLLLVFTAMSLGQLSSSNKTGRSIGAGVTLYMIEQAIAMVTIIIVVVINKETLDAHADEKAAYLDSVMPTVMSYILIMLAIALFIYNVAMIAINSYIVKRKLNLQ